MNRPSPSPRPGDWSEPLFASLQREFALANEALRRRGYLQCLTPFPNSSMVCMVGYADAPAHPVDHDQAGKLLEMCSHLHQFATLDEFWNQVLTQVIVPKAVGTP